MRSLKNCLQQVTQLLGTLQPDILKKNSSTTVDQSKKSTVGASASTHLALTRKWRTFSIDGEMSAVLVARYRDVSRAINCFCPTNKHFCGILWGIPLGHTPPNAKETHSGCLMLRLNRKINWFDLVMHDSPRMAIWWRGDSRFDYGLLSRSCSFQKAKAWCFRTYEQRIAKRYMWHHVPRCPHAFSTCHFIEWKLVLCNILHHL